MEFGHVTFSRAALPGAVIGFSAKRFSVDRFSVQAFFVHTFLR